MLETPEFKSWHRREVMRVLCGEDIEARVTRMMKDIKVEVMKNGKWIEA